jgi:hypothetical protein
MRIRIANCGVMVLLAFSAIPCKADLDGCDNFNENFKDTNRWGTVGNAGFGVLIVTNQRLQYATGSAASGSDRAAQLWILNTGSYTNNWEVQVDFKMPHLNLSEGQSVSFTLVVYPDGNLANRFEIHLNQDQSVIYVFEMDLQGDGGTSVRAETNTLSTSAAARIAFDATTKVLSAAFDEDGANCGYSWKLLGALPVPPAWNMTSTSVFNAVIGAGSRNILVAPSDQVFLDNFKAASGTIAKPTISHAGDSVAISWPTNGPACQVESTATLTPPVCWSVTTNAVTPAGTNFTVTDWISSQNRFFRLSRTYGCQ